MSPFHFTEVEVGSLEPPRGGIVRMRTSCIIRGVPHNEFDELLLLKWNLVIRRPPIALDSREMSPFHFTEVELGSLEPPRGGIVRMRTSCIIRGVPHNELDELLL